MPYPRCPPLPEAVYRIRTFLSALVAACPVGTNLGLVHLLFAAIPAQPADPAQIRRRPVLGGLINNDDVAA